jgi:serine acetyltransferase
MIFTLATFGVEVGVGLGAVVGDGVGVGCVVAVGVEAVVVPPPPHAAKSRATISAKERYAQSDRVRLANDER